MFGENTNMLHHSNICPTVVSQNSVFITSISHWSSHATDMEDINLTEKQPVTYSEANAIYGYAVCSTLLTQDT